MSSLLNHTFTKTSRKSKSKKLRRATANYFEALESRLLMATYTWIGGDDSTTWSKVGNWSKAGTGGGDFPNAADAVVEIPDVFLMHGGGTNSGASPTLTLTLDDNYAVGNLKISGHSSVIIKPKGGDRTLAITPDGGGTTYGHVTLDQVNSVTSLTIAGDGAGHKMTVTARDLTTAGLATAASELIVNSGQKIEFSEDIKADGFKFDLTVHGTLSARKALLMGKGTGNEDKSYATIFGTFTLSDELRIGGTGTTVFAVEMGTVNCKSFQVINGSSLNLIADGSLEARLAGKGQLNFTHGSRVGDGAGFTEATGLNSLAATVDISNGGDLSGSVATADLTVIGGNGVRIDILTDGTMGIDGTLTINGAADENKTGPVVAYSTNNVMTRWRNFIKNLYIQNWDDKPSGTLQIDGADTVVIVWDTVKLWSKFPQADPLIKLNNGSLSGRNWVLNNLAEAGGYATIHAIAGNLEIGSAVPVGGISSFGGMALGGNSCNATLKIDGASVNQIAGATFTKDKHAYITGAGGAGLTPTLTADAIDYNGSHLVVQTRKAARLLGQDPNEWMPLADIMPGDYYDGADDYTMPTKTESPSNPFGTMKLASLLSNEEEANLGLDIVLGSDSGENSNLSVVGDIFINGYLFAEAFDDETEFEVGDKYTVISAGGTRTGYFQFLPQGLVVGTGEDCLPELPSGLGWYIHYGEHEVTLTVKEISTARTSAEMLDIMPLTQRSLSVKGVVGAGYGYGYGSIHLQEWEGGVITDSDSEGVTWTSATSYPFTLTVADGAAEFVMFGQTLNYTFSGGINDLFIRGFSDQSAGGVSAVDFELDDLPLDTSVWATYTSGPAETIYEVFGIHSNFVLTGEVSVGFSTASMPTGNVGFELIFGETNLGPVTVDSSINTAGHVTLDWSTPSANTTLIEIDRSDNGGDTYRFADYARRPLCMAA